MRKNAATAYAIYCAGDGFLFHLAFTVYSVFVVLVLDLDPFQLVLLGTVLEGTYLVFEVPTGVVADTASRRLSVVIGLVGSGVAFTLLGFANSFAMAAVAQFLWGVFATFQSGADVAWLTDELGEEAARPHYIRGGQIWNVAALVGIVASVAIACLRAALRGTPVTWSAIISIISSSRAAKALRALAPSRAMSGPSVGTAQPWPGSSRWIVVRYDSTIAAKRFSGGVSSASWRQRSVERSIA